MKVPYCIGDLKRDPNVENHPYVAASSFLGRGLDPTCPRTLGHRCSLKCPCPLKPKAPHLDTIPKADIKKVRN